MKYYILLLIQPAKSEQFIEVGLNYKLPFHPNLTDEITVADYPCVIKEIYYDLDNLNYVTMRAEAINNLMVVRPTTTSQQIHEWLSNEWSKLKRWKESRSEKIILNNYLYYPKKEINVEHAAEWQI